MEEDLRRCWRDTTFRVSDTPNDKDRRFTALQQLACHYKRFSNLALMLIVMIPLPVSNAMRHSDSDAYPAGIAVIALGVAYLLTCSLMDRWLYRGISAIDVAEMPVAEVCRLAFYYKKKHLQFIAILIPFAILFLGSMAWLFSGEIYLIYGMATGAVIGLLLGYRQFRIFMEEYRDITRD